MWRSIFIVKIQFPHIFPSPGYPPLLAVNLTAKLDWLHFLEFSPIFWILPNFRNVAEAKWSQQFALTIMFSFLWQPSSPKLKPCRSSIHGTQCIGNGQGNGPCLIATQTSVGASGTGLTTLDWVTPPPAMHSLRRGATQPRPQPRQEMGSVGAWHEIWVAGWGVAWV